MSATLEHAREGLEHAHHAAEGHGEGHDGGHGGGHGDRFARWVAVLISVLAAALALSEMQEKASQNLYVTHHIQVSDDYAFYQAKTVRSNLYALHARTLELLPNASDGAIQKEIAYARSEGARLDDEPGGNGRKQLQEQAERDKKTREFFFERYERFELIVGALQIAIVLASVSIVTRVRLLAYVGGAVGGVAIIAGLLVFFSAA